MKQSSKHLILTHEVNFDRNAKHDERIRLKEELMDLLNTKLRDSGVFDIDELIDSDASIRYLEVFPDNRVRVQFEVNAEFQDLESLAFGCDSGPCNMCDKSPTDFEMDARKVEFLIKAIRECK